VALSNYEIAALALLARDDKEGFLRYARDDKEGFLRYTREDKEGFLRYTREDNQRKAATTRPPVIARSGSDKAISWSDVCCFGGGSDEVALSNYEIATLALLARDDKEGFLRYTREDNQRKAATTRPPVIARSGSDEAISWSDVCCFGGGRDEVALSNYEIAKLALLARDDKEGFLRYARDNNQRKVTTTRPPVLARTQLLST